MSQLLALNACQRSRFPFVEWPLQAVQYLDLLNCVYLLYIKGFPGGSGSKESACNAGNRGSVPESGRSAGEGNSYPFQYSCLENPMGRGAWQATVHEVAKNRTQLCN